MVVGTTIQSLVAGIPARKAPPLTTRPPDQTVSVRLTPRWKTCFFPSTPPLNRVRRSLNFFHFQGWKSVFPVADKVPFFALYRQVRFTGFLRSLRVAFFKIQSSGKGPGDKSLGIQCLVIFPVEIRRNAKKVKKNI
jgi:hypothetical protein